MIAGNLPFDQEIATCKRFQTFSKWIIEYRVSKRRMWEDIELELPSWLFPIKFSNDVKRLLVGLLHPDPIERLSVYEAKRHVWCGGNHQLNQSPVRKSEFNYSEPKMEVVNEEVDTEEDDDDNDDDSSDESDVYDVQVVDNFEREVEFFSMEEDHFVDMESKTTSLDDLELKGTSLLSYQRGNARIYFH
jgi:serine/threonine protein kinase